MSTNKELQEQRMKSYFVQATKEIIKAEGIKAVSVRNIASQAGYSYATLYNYFRDAKDLIFECVKEFQEEIGAYINAHKEGKKAGKEGIEAVYTGFINYFIEYPGIFELFYLEKMSDISTKPEVSEIIAKMPGNFAKEEWDYCIEKQKLTPQQATQVCSQLNLLSIGLLICFLNRRYPGDYKEFQKTMKQQLKLILDSLY